MNSPIAPAQVQISRPRKHAKAYAQAVALQKLIMADIENPATKASVRAGCVRAWDILEERKRILRGKPLPGHLRPDLPASQRKPAKRVALLAEVIDQPQEEAEPKESTSQLEGGGTLPGQGPEN